MLKPEKLLPYYRHGSQTPWGGTRLKSLYGRDIPDETTGESLGGRFLLSFKNCFFGHMPCLPAGYVSM